MNDHIISKKLAYGHLLTPTSLTVANCAAINTRGKPIISLCWRDSPILLWGQRFGHIVKMIVLPAVCHG